MKDINKNIVNKRKSKLHATTFVNIYKYTTSQVTKQIHLIKRKS